MAKNDIYQEHISTACCVTKVKCSGCGKDITNSDYTIYTEMTRHTNRISLYFCQSCTAHINRGGSIFFTTYNFEPSNANV